MEKTDILITADSICDLPAELTTSLPIVFMPFYILAGEGRFVDGKEVNAEAILRYMQEGHKVASVPPSKEEYLQFFQEQLASAGQILHITMGKKSSDSYSNALAAAKDLNKVTVFDSGQISGGYGLVVLHAAKLAADQLSFERVLSETKRLAAAVSSDFIVKDTTYMKQAGRISGSAKNLSDSLMARPLLGMRDDRIAVRDIFFGRWEQVIRQYVRKKFYGRQDIDTSVLFVTCVGCEKKTQELIREEVGKYIRFEKIYFQPASAAVSGNSGAGTFGLFFQKKLRQRKSSQNEKREGSFVENVRRRILSTIVRPELTIQQRVMNLILYAALIGGSVSLAINLVLQAWKASGAVAVMLLAVFFSIWLSKHKSQEAGGIFICSVANFILFPIMFFVSGGIHSGMPVWLVLGLILDWLILKGWTSIILFALHFSCVAACIWVSESNKELLAEMPENYMMYDVMQTIFIVACIFGIIFKYQSYVYEKQNQKLKEHEQELVAASSAKDIFLANMSHEIRTPINGIIGMDTMLLKERGNDPKVQEYAVNIRNASQTLLSIVNDILDISKIESGKMELVPVRYELFSVLSECFVMTTARIQDKPIQFHVRLNPAIPEELYGDEVRLRQIMNNLLSNGVKYTPEGRVTLTVDMEQKNDAVILLLISVSDTGIGIRRQDMDKLFHNFTRLDEEKNRNVEGTGLGLNLTRRLVEMMGGTISVDSIYGQGSTFTVRIPQAIKSRNPVGDFEKRMQAELTENITTKVGVYAPEASALVVDDVPMNLMVIRGLLKYTEMTVDTADSGKKALELAGRKKYDIIFMDHLMPGMDGVECFKCMQSLALNQDTPVIILTANAVLGARKEYLKIGFTDYLSKPIEDEQLYEQLQKYLPKEKLKEPPQEEADIREAGVKEKKQREKQRQAQEEPEHLSWMDRLRRIDGLDADLGLQYCMEEEDLYREALGMYISGEKSEALDQCLKQEDFENYRIYVHALKSTSMNIGATVLSEEARISEFACKEENYELVEMRHEELMRQYRELLRRLRQETGG